MMDKIILGEVFNKFLSGLDFSTHKPLYHAN